MALTAGSRLGPYEIVAVTGAGGMGVVYRARAPRLKRDVALKVLPPGLTQDAGRLQRFEQESLAAAALNHPNGVSVYDVGLDDSGPYVVSELLEGETLGALLARGTLPQRTAVDLATQVARGMAAAHQGGIVHRDLKPENIFVTTDGRVKILDFGLAKLTESAGVQPHAVTAAATMPGTVMGTAGYMSPEQVRGGPTDFRTDIFAFGAVLYEMLSGRRAFGGDSAVETMTAILKADPPELPPSGVHPALERVVRRCLEKNPAQRFQSAGDLAFALETLSQPTAPAPAVAMTAPVRRWLKPVAAGAALLAAGVAIGALAGRRTTADAPAAGFRALTFDRWPVTGARFMPDGQTVVYSAAPRGLAPELFVLSPHVEGPQPLGIPNAQLLSVSSRGELAIIINAQHVNQRLFTGTLARMTMGSSPRAVLDGVREADWSPDGASRVPRGYQQDLAGSAPETMTPEGVLASLAPDGRTLLLTLRDGSSQLSSIAGGPARPVTALRREDTLIAWSRDSRSVFVQRGVHAPAVVERVDLTTNERTTVATLAPDGLGAVAMISVADWADDGRWYAYNYTSIPSTLYVVSSATR